eukprot:99454_1
MGNCRNSVDDEWTDSSEESKLDLEKQPFTFCSNSESNNEDPMKGWLFKKSKHLGSWRKRWTLLDKSVDGNMFHLQTFKDNTMNAKPTEIIPIDGVIVIQTNQHNPNQFTIYQKSSHKAFIFRASSTQRRDQWIHTLSHQVKRIQASEANDFKLELQYWRPVMDHMAVLKDWRIVLRLKHVKMTKIH